MAKNSAKKQLFIDISELVNQDAKTGIQRVVRSILNALLTNPPSEYAVKAVYANTTEQGYFYAQEFLDTTFKSNQNKNLGMLNGKCLQEMKQSSRDSKVVFTANDIFLGLDLQHHVVLSQESFYQKMREQGVKVYFVVYDLLPVLMPHVFHESVENLHYKWLSVLAQQDGVICISKAVADEFKNWVKTYKSENIDTCNVEWFHLGADMDASVPTQGVPEDGKSVLNTLASSPTFLIVGTIEPRKGQKQVLSAFDLLWSEGADVNLVIVGKQGWDVDKLIKKMKEHPKLNQQLFWLNGISDEYLEAVYRVSSCLIAASEGEGFGLPLIEAAQKKLPIIARDIPVFREVAGEFAYYFADDNDPLILVKTITEWIELYKNNEHPKSDAMPWLTWEESAKQLLKYLK